MLRSKGINIKIQIILMLVAYIMLSGCLNMAWVGYKKPLSTDFVNVGCMEIGKQNLNTEQWKAIKEASSDVCLIFSDPEFKQWLTSKNWLASCNKIYGKPDTISGLRVYDLLTKKTLKYSIHPHKPWNAEGQAETNESNINLNRIAIIPSQIEDWLSSVDTIRSRLINTIAHESVHILSDDFLDYDLHGSSVCPDSLLLSYAIGNMTEKIWLKHHKK